MLTTSAAPAGSPRCRAAGLTGPIPLLFLITNLDRGGAEKALTRLAIGLPREKYGVQVAALQARSGVMAADLDASAYRSTTLACVEVGPQRVLCGLRDFCNASESKSCSRLCFTRPFWATRGMGVPRPCAHLFGADHGVGGSRAANAEPLDRPLGDPRGGGVRARCGVRAARVPGAGGPFTTIPNGVDLVHFRPAARPARSKPPS